MPNKYEREIEEILRNLERTEPKAGFGQRVSGRMRRRAGARRGLPTLRLSFSEWCLAIGFAAALGAGGWAYAQGEGNVVTGVIALIGAVCIALVALSSFLARPHYASSTRYNNVTPLRGNPLRRLAASWHLLLLKMRYRNRGDRER